MLPRGVSGVLATVIFIRLPLTTVPKMGACVRPMFCKVLRGSQDMSMSVCMFSFQSIDLKGGNKRVNLFPIVSVESHFIVRCNIWVFLKQINYFNMTFQVI